MRTTDVVLGTTVAGRSATLPGVERGVGLFINTLPMRVAVKPSQRLGDWMKGIQANQIGAQEHEHTSLAAIQRWSDAPSGRALFESIVVFENYPPPEGREPGNDLTVGNVTYAESSNYPLAVLVEVGESLEVVFVYDTARLSMEAIASLGSQMTKVLEEFVAGPDARLSSFRIVADKAEREMQAFGTGPPLDTDDRTIHEIISSVAARCPDSAAVSFDDRSITYRQLDNLADAMAARLAAAGVGPGRLVGLHVTQSIEMIVGMLGILKAGGAYVPLDPTYPVEHIRGLLTGDAIDVVLTDSEGLGDLPGSMIIIDVTGPAPAAPAIQRPRVTSDGLAYVIHTSGSTARPKGVMVTHRSLDPVGRFLLLSSFAFDSSVAGIFWTLATGGTLVLPPPHFERNVDGLLALAKCQRVTHTLCLPSLYRVLLDNAQHDELPSLQVAIVAGEACPSGVVASHFDRLPTTALHNEYGPTEATVWATVHKATAADQDSLLPIGRPIAGSSVFLLDEYGHRVPLGFPGELCIAGAAVTSGYLSRPDLTAERFVTVELDGARRRIYRSGDLATHRADGTIDFLGRVDRQLKIRGHRIEAGAVESALRELPSIDDVAVSGRAATGRGGTQLVAHVVAGDRLDVSRLTASLRASLPGFMVPDVIIPVDELPRLANGKVDIAALLDPAVASDSYVAPRTEAEATLCAIWSELLAVDAVGVRDDFFALGGDSIVSLQMISRARQAGVHIQPGQVTAHPTIESLAAAASISFGVHPDQRPVTGSVPLGPIQRWFFELDLAEPSHWNQSNLFELPVDVDVDALEVALQACLDRHDMLRVRFEKRADGWHQIIDGPRKIALEVIDETDPDLDAVVLSQQSSLDLETGPLHRTALIRRGPSSAWLLLIVAHHLIIDVVSWAILMEDMESAYRQALGGQSIELPPRTTAFRDWVTHLESVDRSDELGYWSRQGDVRGGSIDGGLEQSDREVTLELNAAATRQLLTVANDAYQTRSEDLLVAALSDVAAAWMSSDEVTIMMESHGRPSDIDGVDLSGTIGWFTSLYPVTLQRGADDASLIKAAKERLRAVPNRGVGYACLNYLDQEPNIRKQAMPPISFNYLSRTSEDRAGGILTWVSSLDDTTRSPRNTRPHLLEVVAEVRRNSLTMHWHYSSELHDEVTVAGLAQAHLDRLLQLVSHCTTPGAQGFTPSDFPESGFDQDELDRFLDRLE